MLFDSDHGLTPPTIDVVATMEWNEYQKWKLGYIGVNFKYEYADLAEEAYKRYTLGATYNFVWLRNNSLTTGFGINGSQVDRFTGYSGKMSFGLGFQSDITYRFSNHFAVSLLSTYDQRPDIKRWRYNNYLGLKYIVFKRKRNWYD